jgi:hypothetical protein
VTITARDKPRHLTAMLDIASKFPRLLADGSPADECHAVSWLLNERQLLEQLAQSQSMSAADVADAAGVDK